eukprot:1140460-Pelagomonas_calceolata.AAC.1
MSRETIPWMESSQVVATQACSLPKCPGPPAAPAAVAAWRACGRSTPTQRLLACTDLGGGQVQQHQQPQQHGELVGAARPHSTC